MAKGALRPEDAAVSLGQISVRKWLTITCCIGSTSPRNTGSQRKIIPVTDIMMCGLATLLSIEIPLPFRRS